MKKIVKVKPAIEDKDSELKTKQKEIGTGHQSKGKDSVSGK